MSKFTFPNTDRIKLKDCKPTDQNLIIQAVGGDLLEWVNWDRDGSFVKWMKHDFNLLSAGASYRVIDNYTLDDALNEVARNSGRDDHDLLTNISSNHAMNIIRKLAIGLGDKS